ncbi:MAG: M61 family metallopeptidase [Nannocystaceae bacterium]
MRRPLRILPSLISLLWFATLWMAAPDDAAARRRARRAPVGGISYSVDLSKVPYDRLEVRMEVERPRGKSTRLALPAWTPGSYLIRDFARDLSDMRARTASGAPLPVTRVDKQTWEVRHGGQDFVAEYFIHARTLSVRTSYSDDAVAVLNGASIFTYIPGATDLPVKLRVQTQPGASIATSLEATEGGFRAPDYDHLVDAPLSIGTPVVRSFIEDGTTFEYVLHAPEGTNADIDRLVDDARKIVRASGEIMGGFPFKRYVFHVICDRNGGGGLEHDDSTVMLLRPWAFSSPYAYRRAASLLAHEFFHAWNVKRIHDRVLGPFDYSAENYTDLLWFHEGFTETMEARIMLRAGLVSSDEFLRTVERSLNRYRAHPGRDASPIAEISRVAWVEAYKPAPHHANTSISYYLKGNLVGLSLDLALRSKSVANGLPPASVERLFQALWARRDARQRVSISEEMVIAEASKLAGEDLHPFFDRHVRGRIPLPLVSQLERFGIDASPAESPSPTLGMRLDGDLTIVSLERDGPAQAAGLLVGDELLAIDRIRLDDTERLQQFIEHVAAGTTFRVLFSRAGRILERAVKSRPPEVLPLSLERSSTPPAGGESLRAWWLGEGAPPTAAAQ